MTRPAVAAAWLNLLFAPLLLAADAVENRTVENKAESEEAADILAGHSYHGEAFNEGPRQGAYLMDGLGQVDFPVTTSSEQAQQFITQGVAQLHGFWYFEAERSFRQAASLDPDCAMAYWGMAMANQANRERGQGFVAKAVERRDGASAREQKYIDALEAYFEADPEKKQPRDEKYTDALEKLLYEFPDDVEAKAFLALQLWKNRSSGIKISSHLAVDALLEQVFEVNPMHPAHHYRIHLWDREKPERALESAARCGQSLPAIAHMWHMPGHIYSGLKRYHDAAWQQEASARVDHAHMMRDRVLPDQISNFAHNNEWLIRNLNHVGRIHDAIDLARNMIELPRHPKYNVLGKRGSTYYGRLRLFETLNRFELWEELQALCHTTCLEPTDDPNEQIKRLRNLARAAWRLGDEAEGQKWQTALEERLNGERSQRDEAIAAVVAEAAEEESEADASSAPQADSSNADSSNADSSNADSSNADSSEADSDEATTSDDAKSDEAADDGAKPREASVDGSDASSTDKDASESEAAESPAKLSKAQKKAARPFDSRIRKLEQALGEVRGLQAVLAEDYELAFKELKDARVDPMYLAHIQLLAGDKDEAIERAEKHLKTHVHEVRSLACFIRLLWDAGRKQQAEIEFEKLRSLSSACDLDSPVFTALEPIAAELGWKDDWRLPPLAATDVGQRPDLDTLGPFRWAPQPAPSWTLQDAEGRPYSLKEYRGKPLLVIFYLGYGCLHCAEQLHAFAPRLDEFSDAGIQVVAISTDDQEGLRMSIAGYESGPLPIPLLSDNELEAFRSYRAYDDFEAQPLHGSFLIDSEGRIRWQDVSYEPFMDPDFVLEEAQRLLAQ